MADNNNNNETRPPPPPQPQAIPVKVQLESRSKTWGQRAEIAELCLVGTATGVAIAESVPRYVARKATPNGLRHAASFASDFCSTLFSK